MDFEGAAQRLARDQRTLRGRKPVAVSAKAKQEAEYRKKQQDRLRLERLRQQRQQKFIEQYHKRCERSLGVKPLTYLDDSLQLIPTSIWGDGDKIALPPSVLEYLTQSDGADGTSISSPWMFRIGVLREGYKFPSSPLLKTLQPPKEEEGDDSDEEHENAPEITKDAYLDELSHKYISYTHGSVVEFTQEEGHVGLPAPIAHALLDDKNIPTRRTKDPAVAVDPQTMHVDEVDDEKTPGHVAYGAFDVPDLPLEITMIQLPKGKACTLTPTPQAIQNGFYNLQNVKLVLEQSLIRTRATLSVGDLVQTWHRGVQFDLVVSKVTPSTFHAVTCINTDIEVEFGALETATDNHDNQPTTTSAGRTLSSSPPSGGSAPSGSTQPSSGPAPIVVDLLPEPPVDQRDNICTVQIRAERSGRRRFDIRTATMRDLFQFASTLLPATTSTTEEAGLSFQLVTRFPRNIYQNSELTLQQAGIPAGQELFMVERL